MDRILGPAYPAILAPGLRVVLHDPDGPLDALDATVVRICGLTATHGARALPGAVVVYETEAAGGPSWEAVGLAALRVDYADRNTLDRVARALWSTLHPTREVSPWTSPDVGDVLAWSVAPPPVGAWAAWTDTLGPYAAKVRAVAAAVWGGA